jgi:hypothetical protein
MHTDCRAGHRSSGGTLCEAKPLFVNRQLRQVLFCVTDEKNDSNTTSSFDLIPSIR